VALLTTTTTPFSSLGEPRVGFPSTKYASHDENSKVAWHFALSCNLEEKNLDGFKLAASQE
jgi:hypothetical protein